MAVAVDSIAYSLPLGSSPSDRLVDTNTTAVAGGRTAMAVDSRALMLAELVGHTGFVDRDSVLSNRSRLAAVDDSVEVVHWVVDRMAVAGRRIVADD